MKASLITKNVEFLNNLFSEFTPLPLLVDYIGEISVFSFLFETEDCLNNNWNKVTSSIASYYQSGFENEENQFERWNIYILFLVKKTVGIQLKYKIENDRFSSRKIIVDNISEILDIDLMKKLIAKHIINSDLDMFDFGNPKDSKVDIIYSNDSKIYQLVENSNLKMSGRGANKEELDGLYQQIIKEISNEIQESRNTGI